MHLQSPSVQIELQENKIYKDFIEDDTTAVYLINAIAEEEIVITFNVHEGDAVLQVTDTEGF